MHFHVNLPLSVTLEPIAPLQSPHQKVAEALSLCIQRSETWVAGCLHGNISECKFCSFSDHLPRLAGIWYYQKVMGRSLVPCEVPLLQDEKETHQLLAGQNPTTSLSMEDPPQNVQITLYLKELLDFFRELGEGDSATKLTFCRNLHSTKHLAGILGIFTGAFQGFKALYMGRNDQGILLGDFHDWSKSYLWALMPWNPFWARRGKPSSSTFENQTRKLDEIGTTSLRLKITRLHSGIALWQVTVKSHEAASNCVCGTPSRLSSQKSLLQITFKRPSCNVAHWMENEDDEDKADVASGRRKRDNKTNWSCCWQARPTKPHQRPEIAKEQL